MPALRDEMGMWRSKLPGRVSVSAHDAVHEMLGHAEAGRACLRKEGEGLEGGIDKKSPMEKSPIGKEEREPRALVCQGVSPWGEPCPLPAPRRCEVCRLWFCEQHFTDPHWHPCTRSRNNA